MQRLVLNMIVKNEGHVLGRLLASVVPHISGYVISDTGSTDNTREVIEEGTRELPGRIVEEPWQSFGHNRTRALEEAQEWVEAEGWDPASTYLLLLDADMVLCAPHGFDLEKLTLPAYSLVQKTPDLSYPNTRLVRADHAWRSVGVTHEYWAGPGIPAPTLEGVWIDDRNDGGSRGDKFERDAALLEEGLRKEPENVRYMFYLAQTYFDLGRFRDAAAWYEAAWMNDTFDQERWFARFKWGRALLALGDTAGVDILLRAFEERPTRAEPLYYLARYYREQGQHHAATMLIDRARQIPEPGVELFVEKGVYGNLIREETAITSFYVGRKLEGAAECEWLARQRGQSASHYEHISRNASHYAEPLKALRKGKIEVPAELLKGYTSSSPTLVEHEGELVAHIRLVNYDHHSGRAFVSRDPDRVIRTRGVACRFRFDDEPVWLGEVEDKAFLPRAPARVEGLEDQRWTSHAGLIYFTANTWQIEGKPYPQMVLGLIASEPSGRLAIAAVTPLEHGEGTQKNWLPWPRDDELFIVYGYDPFTILHVNKKVMLAGVQPSPWAAHRFRGSAGPVRHPEKPGHWIVMVHEVAASDHERVYMQRLIEIDPLLRPVALSRPFYLDHRGVEFPLGFVSRGKSAIITYGREERESCWIEVSWPELLSRLDFP